MSEPLWSDERISNEVQQAGRWLGHRYGPESFNLLDEDVEDLLHQMRDEYEAKLAQLQQAEPPALGVSVSDNLDLSDRLG